MNNFNTTDIREALSNTLETMVEGDEIWEAQCELIERVNKVAKCQEDILEAETRGNGTSGLKTVLRIFARQWAIEEAIQTKWEDNYIEKRTTLDGETPSKAMIASYVRRKRKSKQNDGTRTWEPSVADLLNSRKEKTAEVAKHKASSHQGAKEVGQIWGALWSMKDIEKYQREENLKADPGCEPYYEEPQFGEHAVTILTILN